jgi:CBS domain-containing protein
MYFIPAGLLLKNNSQVLAATQEILGGTPDLSNLTISGFLLNNLLPVTIGNIIGGTFFVGIVHWFLFLRPAAVEPVRRMMRSGPPAVNPSTTVAEAVKIMKQQGSSSVLVGEPGRAKGIVSEADVAHKVVALEKDSADVQVDQIMTSPLISVDIATPVYEIYQTMTEHQIRHLLITESGKQVGFVSVKDLIAKPMF